MLAARDGGVPGAITHGEDASLIERDDLEGLVRYASLLAGGRALPEAMGARGRMSAEQRFGDSPVGELEGLYSALIDRTFRRDGTHLAPEALRT